MMDAYEAPEVFTEGSLVEFTGSCSGGSSWEDNTPWGHWDTKSVSWWNW